MPACVQSELCEIGDGRVGTVSCWMPEDSEDPAGGMLVLRVGFRSVLVTGIRRVRRARGCVRVQGAGGRWLELRRVYSRL